MEKILTLDLSDIVDFTPQLVPDSYFEAQGLTRKQLIGDYLHELKGLEREIANQHAADFHFEDRPLASTVVLIPIAAHQEAPNIANAALQYANQETDQPFSVLLYPNAPFGTSPSATDATLEEIELAKKAHPGLDLRSTPVEYYDKPKIGAIRRNLWNAALLLAHYEGAFDQTGDEVIGINNDIDIVRQSPRNMRRVQKWASNQQRKYNEVDVPNAITPPRNLFVRHAYDPEYPNTARAVFWYDFSYAQLRSKGSYEAGLILPFSFYAHRGGYQADATLVESRSVLNGKKPVVIPGTILETSPRRFAQRLNDTSRLFNIWTNDTFGADDECRTTKAPDISEAKLKNLVHGSLTRSMDYFLGKTIDQYEEIYETEVYWELRDSAAVLEEFVAALERKKRLAVTVLDRVLELPYTAEILSKRSQFDMRLIAEQWWKAFERKYSQ